MSEGNKIAIKILLSDKTKTNHFGHKTFNLEWGGRGETPLVTWPIPPLKHGGGSIMVHVFPVAGIGAIESRGRLTENENIILEENLPMTSDFNKKKKFPDRALKHQPKQSRTNL